METTKNNKLYMKDRKKNKNIEIKRTTSTKSKIKIENIV